jgi:hypothetical protein
MNRPFNLEDLIALREKMKELNPISPALQEILNRMGAKCDFDPAKHTMILHSRFQSMIPHPPEWLSFSSMIEPNQVIMMERPNIDFLDIEMKFTY